MDPAPFPVEPVDVAQVRPDAVADAIVMAAWADHHVASDLRVMMDQGPYCDRADVRTVLLATTDGGRTWSVIGG